MLAATCLGLFAGLALAVHAGWTQALDRGLMLAVGRTRSPWATPVMRAVSVLGSGSVEIPLAILVSLRLAALQRRRAAAGYAAATFSGWALSGLAKLAVRRPRPHVLPRLMRGGGWFSFPSGHATLAPLVFGLGSLIWSAPWPVRMRLGGLLLATGLTLLIGYSRVYLGMHWPSDILGGYLMGVGWAALWAWWWERSAIAQ
jgi:undecaprenyl-diphosphatase